MLDLLAKEYEELTYLIGKPTLHPLGDSLQHLFPPSIHCCAGYINFLGPRNEEKGCGIKAPWARQDVLTKCESEHRVLAYFTDRERAFPNGAWRWACRTSADRWEPTEAARNDQPPRTGYILDCMFKFSN